MNDNLSGELVIEEDRRMIYDRIQDVFENDGIDLDAFFGNSSYFGKDERGSPIPWRGSHPTLIHWPLSDYPGGSNLLDVLRREIQVVENLTTPGAIVWVQPQYWHATVFSPVHSGNPQVIARARTDIAEPARREVRSTAPYRLSFTRIVVTHDAGIKAVGYADSHQLNELRSRLKQSVPEGHASPLIHISLGNIVKPLDTGSLNRLKAYARKYRSDQVLLGRIAVSSLCYARYTGPFTEMTVSEIFRQALEGR